jgi:anti-sigma B factor antagonist
MPEPFEVLRMFITNKGSSSRLEVGGEIDAGCAEVLREHLGLLIDAATGDVDVDMAAVEFCDSTGLRELLSARQQLLVRGRRLRVTNASVAVTRLLDLAGVSHVLMSVNGIEPAEPRSLR